MGNRILIIEDDGSIREILCYALRKEGFEVEEAGTGTSGLRIAAEEKIDLLILDLMLPDMSGLEICRIVSVEYRLPVIMLTAKSDITDKVLGLEIGADDYITKPFDIREVVARVKAGLRKIEQLKEAIENNTNRIKLKHNIVIYTDRHEVYKDNQLVCLKPKEYELLVELAENRGLLFTRDKLLEKVWGFDFEGESRTVDVHVQRLRKKLDSNKGSSIIETVFGFGYKLT